MRTFLNTTVLILLLAATSGCSRFRQLTRRDYARLHDPFASHLTDEEAIAQHARENDKAKNTAGIVRLDNDAATTNQISKTVTVAQSTALPNESASNSFPGVKVRGMGDVTANQSGPSLSDFVGKPAEPAVAAITGSASEALVGSDLADFTSFLEQQATASGITETARKPDEDFAQWAAAEKQEWQQKTTAVAKKATPLINPIQQVSQAVSAAGSADHANRTAVKNMTHPASHPASDAVEIATPLLQNSTSARPSVNPIAPTADTRSTAPIGVKTPFANPPSQIAESDLTSPSSQIAHEAPAFDFNEVSEVSSESGKLDSGFNFDSGWKPSNLVLP